MKAGVAKTEITTHEPGIKVHDPLYAKVLMLDDSKTCVVIIAMDAVAIGGICDISDSFLGELRRRMEASLGIDGRNVLVNASHTHTAGPMLCNEPELLDKTIDAVKRAYLSMLPAKIGWGLGFEDNIMINRSLRLNSGKHWTIRQANPCPPDKDVAGLGPIDPDIGILKVDQIDGQPIAVLYNFSCHPLLGVPDGSVTANYPGYASAVIEEQTGAMALFLQGSLGDVTEVLYKDVNRPMDSRPVGQTLGLSTLKALREIKSVDTEDQIGINVINETIRLPRRTDLPEQIEMLRREQAEQLKSLRATALNFKTFLPLYIKYSISPDYPSDYAYRYMHEVQNGCASLTDLDSQNKKRLSKYLGNISAMEQLARIEDRIATFERHQKINDDSGEDEADAEIMGIRIGECVLISAPVELLAEVGLNIKKASPYRHTFVVSPSNGYMHYGPPAAYYELGGYEVTECFLSPEWQRLFEEKALDIIKRL